MILFDPKSKAVSSTGGKKLEKKGKAAASAKFSTNKEVSDTTNAQDVSEVANIAPMLFLQEVDQYKQDQQELESFAEKAFKGLKDLQLAVLSGQLDEKHLLNLQSSLKKNHSYIVPELKALAEEIELRVSIEIAKLERSKH